MAIVAAEASTAPAHGSKWGRNGIGLHKSILTSVVIVIFSEPVYGLRNTGLAAHRKRNLLKAAKNVEIEKTPACFTVLID